MNNENNENNKNNTSNSNTINTSANTSNTNANTNTTTTNTTTNETIEDRTTSAQEAFASGDVAHSKHVHDTQYEKHSTSSGKYLKSAVYGGLDGIITTFAVVAGVAGASLSSGVVLILGFANLIADGLSMSIGDYLSTKSEQEYNRLERQRESWEMQNYPEGEIREVKEIYEDKGMTPEDAELVVGTMAKYEDLFIDVMMVEELGIIEDNESPVKNAVVTFLSFLVFGFIPLLATVLAYFIPGLKPYAFVVSSVMTGVTLFILGAAKSKVSGVNWFRSGLEMLIVGGLAATAAYLIGYFLGGLGA